MAEKESIMLMKNHNYLYDFDVIFSELMEYAKLDLETEDIDLLNLKGRVLAHEIYAPMSLPQLDLSAMDGFAISSKSDQKKLVITECVYAGEKLVDNHSKNQAFRVMTGASVPTGMDCIIPIEDALLIEEKGKTFLLNPCIYTPEKVASGKHIRAIGSDMKKGECLLQQGTVLGAEEIGLIASLGFASVSVYRKLRIGLLTSGNELTNPGEQLNLGSIYDANRFLIHTLLSKFPIEVCEIKQCVDDFDDITQALAEMQSAVDLIITVGGASVGDKDYIPQALRAMNARVHRYKLKMKPAKPLTYAKLNNSMLLALPGNPVAAYFSYQVFVAPFIRKLIGCSFWENQSLKLPLSETCQAPAEKLLWLPVRFSKNGVIPLKGSVSQLSLLTQADGYIRIEAGQSLQRGDLTNVWSLKC